MGDKGKGKDSGQAKKAKNVKTGNRPHEQRAREAGKKGPTTGPLAGPTS